MLYSGNKNHTCGFFVDASLMICDNFASVIVFFISFSSWKKKQMSCIGGNFLQVAPFDPTKKKKKKKVVIQDPADDVDKLAEKTENLTGALVLEPGKKCSRAEFGGQNESF